MKNLDSKLVKINQSIYEITKNNNEIIISYNGQFIIINKIKLFDNAGIGLYYNDCLIKFIECYNIFIEKDKNSYILRYNDLFSPINKFINNYNYLHFSFKEIKINKLFNLNDKVIPLNIQMPLDNNDSIYEKKVSFYGFLTYNLSYIKRIKKIIKKEDIENIFKSLQFEIIEILEDNLYLIEFVGKYNENIYNPLLKDYTCKTIAYEKEIFSLNQIIKKES